MLCLLCCEALMASIIDNLELDVPRKVIAMSSGMAVGVGRSVCFCMAPAKSPRISSKPVKKVR